VASSKPKPTLLQGSLDLLILRTLVGGPQHGYAIARHLAAVSQEFLQVEEGSLYPALHRLEHRGLIEAKWGVSDANRKAKFYRLTAKGRKQLDAETAAWLEMSQAIDRILNFKAAEA
jgi:transcriptional regulator